MYKLLFISINDREALEYTFMYVNDIVCSILFYLFIYLYRLNSMHACSYVSKVTIMNQNAGLKRQLCSALFYFI